MAQVGGSVFTRFAAYFTRKAEDLQSLRNEVTKLEDDVAAARSKLAKDEAHLDGRKKTLQALEEDSQVSTSTPMLELLSCRLLLQNLEQAFPGIMAQHAELGKFEDAGPHVNDGVTC
jgi:chromosome segregation ATPase